MLILCAVAVGLMCHPATAIAAEYSATMTIKTSGTAMKSMGGLSKPMNAKLYVKGNKKRQELPGINMVVITRGDKGVMWQLLPDQKVYMEMANFAGAGGGDSSSNRWTAMAKSNPKQVKKVGTATVNGYLCDKYKANPQPKLSITAWVSRKLDLEVKVESSMQLDKGNISSTMELSNVKEQKLPDSLFEIPKGFKKKDMPKPSMSMPGKPGQSPNHAKAQ